MKTKKLLVAVTTMLLTSWLFYSCSKNDETTSNTQIGMWLSSESNQAIADVQFYREDVANEGKITLGKKRNNPFKVANINLAKAIVYGSGAPNKVASHK